MERTAQQKISILQFRLKACININLERNMKKSILILLFLVLLAENLRSENGNDYVKAAVITEPETVGVDQYFWVGVHFIVTPGWHVYWKNPGDSGLPTDIEWDLPEGFTIEEIQWPYPEKMVESDLATFGYEKEVLLMAKAKADKGVSPGDYTIKADVSWLVCKEKCFPGSVEVHTDIKVNNNTITPVLKESSLVYKTMNKLPFESSDWLFRAETHADRVFLDIKKPDWFDGEISDLNFFPDSAGTYKHSSEPKVEKTDFGYRVYLDLDNFRDSDPRNIQGIAVISQGWDKKGERKSIKLNIPVINYR